MSWWATLAMGVSAIVMQLSLDRVMAKRKRKGLPSDDRRIGDHPAEMFEGFEGVKRYHTGGIVGLKHGEVPAVISRAEPHHERILQMIAKPKPEKHAYFMGFANHAATASKDTTKVGAVLVGPQGEIRLTGYNGAPIGVHDHTARYERPAKYNWLNHAEENVIAFAAREGIQTKGCTLYTTHQPCSKCSRMIVQAGIKRVVYGIGTTSMPLEEFEIGKAMFREAGVNSQCVG